jgi:hypothetical protein
MSSRYDSSNSLFVRSWSTRWLKLELAEARLTLLRLQDVEADLMTGFSSDTRHMATAYPMPIEQYDDYQPIVDVLDLYHNSPDLGSFDERVGIDSPGCESYDSIQELTSPSPYVADIPSHAQHNRGSASSYGQNDKGVLHQQLGSVLRVANIPTAVNMYNISGRNSVIFPSLPTRGQAEAYFEQPNRDLFLTGNIMYAIRGWTRTSSRASILTTSTVFGGARSVHALQQNKSAAIAQRCRNWAKEHLPETSWLLPEQITTLEVHISYRLGQIHELVGDAMRRWR